MVIQDGCALEEASRMPRILELKLLKIEMMTELVAQRIEECPERRHFLADGRPHPQPDEHLLDVVVAEQFARPVFANREWTGGENAETALRHSVERRRF